MSGTAIDLSAIRTDATSYAASFRALIGVTASSFDGSYSSLSGIPSSFTPASHKSTHIVGGTDAFTAAEIRALLGVSTLSGSNTGDQDLSSYATTVSVVSYNVDQSGTTTLVQKNRALVNLGFNTTRASGAFQFTADNGIVGYDSVRFESSDTGGNGYLDATFVFNAEEGIQFIQGSMSLYVNGSGVIQFNDELGTVAWIESNKLKYLRTISPSEDSTEVATTAWVRDTIPSAAAFTFRFDGAGSALTTGAKKVYFRVPFACTITSWEIVSDVSGSVVFDIWKDTYANYPPTVADTITASAKPTLTSATKAQSSTLTGWTTSLSAGDYVEVNIDSASTLTIAMLTLRVTKV